MNQENMMVVLGSLDLQGLQEIVAKIAATSKIVIMKPARTALVMMGVKDSVQMVPFYLGEVLISQCAVTVDETIGYGFMMGEDLAKVYCLAVIEAALVGKHQLSQEINEIMAERASVIRQQQRIEYSLVAKTKVRFETMEETSDESSN
jgi:alpha-D-ribose 1-methylphosphonate 5-triphosphate synthase subunit PhnG